MKNYEAPKIVNVSIWTAAIFGVLVFSVSLGAYFFGFLDSQQISADTETEAMGKPLGQCKPGEIMYTINNYPGTSNLLPGGHATYYSESDKNWRCSYICVPQGQTLEDYFNSGEFLIDGKRTVIVKSPSMFNDLFEQDPKTAMQRTIILDQSLPTSERQCEGPNSVDYGTIKNPYNGKIIEKVKRADSDYQTSYGQQLTREEEITGAGTIAGAPEPFQAPVTEGTNNIDRSESDKLGSCLKKVNDFIYRYSNRDNLSEDKQKLLNEIVKEYNGLKKSSNPSISKCNETLLSIEAFLTTELAAQSSSTNQSLAQNVSDLSIKIKTQAYRFFDAKTDNTTHETFILVYIKKYGSNSLEHPYVAVAKTTINNNPANLKIKLPSGTTDKDSLVFYSLTSGGLFSRLHRGLKEVKISDIKTGNIINLTLFKISSEEGAVITKQLDIYNLSDINPGIAAGLLREYQESD